MISSLESEAGAFVAVVGVGRKGAIGGGSETLTANAGSPSGKCLDVLRAAGASRVGLAHLRAPSILERSPGCDCRQVLCFFDRSRAAAKRFC